MKVHLSIRSSEHDKPYQDWMGRTEHGSEIPDVEMDAVSEKGLWNIWLSMSYALREKKRKGMLPIWASQVARG